jgi:hypothetical protein
MGQIKFLSGIFMTSLFAIAIVTFAVNFGIDNNSAIVLSDDDDYIQLQTNLTGDVQTFNINANTSSDTIMSTTQESGDLSASSGGQFKVGTGTGISTVTKVIKIGFNKIFGDDETFGIVFTMLISLLVFISGLYIWKAWKGNPD